MRLTSFSVKDFHFVNYTDCDEGLLLEILSYRNSSGIANWMRDSTKITIPQHFTFVNKLKDCENKIYFAVKKGGQYIGSIYIVKNSKGLWERGLYVIPCLQGQGYAALMEKTFIKKVKEIGIDPIVAEVYKNNTASLKFHDRMGYTVMGETDESVIFCLKD